MRYFKTLVDGVFSFIAHTLSNQRGEVGDPGDPEKGGQDPKGDPSVDPNQDPGKQVQTPEYAKAEDVATLREGMNTLRDTLEQLRGGIDALSRRSNESQPQQSPTPQIDDVPDDALDQVLQDGKGAKNLRKAWNADMARKLSAVEKKIAELENFGIQTLSDHGEVIAAPHMPYRNDPRFKTIFDKEISQLHPQLKSNPKVLKALHDRVIGENINLLLKENEEKILRQSREKITPSNPGGPTGRDNNQNNKVPSVKELLGEDAERALVAKGQTADQFAQSLRRGFKTWGDYVEWIRKEEGAEQTNA